MGMICVLICQSPQRREKGESKVSCSVSQLWHSVVPDLPDGHWEEMYRKGEPCYVFKPESIRRPSSPSIDPFPQPVFISRLNCTITGSEVGLKLYLVWSATQDMSLCTDNPTSLLIGQSRGPVELLDTRLSVKGNAFVMNEKARNTDTVELMWEPRAALMTTSALQPTSRAPLTQDPLVWTPLPQGNTAASVG